MQQHILSRSYRSALKLAARCDADLLLKSLLTPPMPPMSTHTNTAGGNAPQPPPSPVSHPPIPLSTSITEIVRNGFRVAPPPAAVPRGMQQRRSSRARGRKDSKAVSSRRGTVMSEEATAAAFFAIRWLQHAVSLGAELRRAKQAAQKTSAAAGGGSKRNPSPSSSSSSSFSLNPMLQHVMPMQMSPTETVTFDSKGASSSAALGRTSVLYAHPSDFEDSVYRGMYACASNGGWGPSTEGAEADGAANTNTNGKKGTKKVSRKRQSAPSHACMAAFPIIQLNHKTEGTTHELFDSMPQLLTPLGGGSGSGGAASASTMTNAMVTTRAHRNILGRLPVYLGGPSAAPQGPYLVHSNHTIAYLLAARSGPQAAASATARPFYVASLQDVMTLPVRVVSTLNANNCRVVVNHYTSKRAMGRGIFIHDVTGRSAPIALFGLAAALLTPAAAAAVAAGRAPYPSLPPNHNDWSAGLHACGLGALGSAAVLSPAQRATVRDSRQALWESGKASTSPAASSPSPTAAVGLGALPKPMDHETPQVPTAARVAAPRVGRLGPAPPSRRARTAKRKAVV